MFMVSILNLKLLLLFVGYESLITPPPAQVLTVLEHKGCYSFTGVGKNGGDPSVGSSEMTTISNRKWERMSFSRAGTDSVLISSVSGSQLFCSVERATSWLTEHWFWQFDEFARTKGLQDGVCHSCCQRQCSSLGSYVARDHWAFQ